MGAAASEAGVTKPAAGRVRAFALACGIVHWAILLVVQVEDFWLYLLPGERRWPSVLGFVAALPFMQAQNVAVAAVLAAGAYACARRRWSGWAFVAVYLLVTAYVLVDQVYYKLFFDHFRVSMAEGLRTLDPSLAASSLAQEADVAVYVNAGLLLGVAAWVAWGRPWRRGEVTPGDARGWRWVPTVGMVLFLLGVPSAVSSTMSNLQHHPLLVLAGDALLPSVGAGVSAGGGGGGDASASWSAAAPSGAVSDDPRLPRAVGAVRGAAGRRRPNVVLVVMESVGAVQCLDARGLPDAAQTPMLAEMADHAVVFPNLYSVFPGTVRTHTAMQTGGYHPTWGSVYELFPFRYRGPTMPVTFSDAGYRTALFSGERLDGEAMDLFMRQVGYQDYYDFADDPAVGDKDVVLNSWGAREEHTLGLVRDWLDRRGAAGDDRPFFLTYLTVATHHPYTVPPGEPTPFAAVDDVGRYRNALHYTDAAIGKLRRLLADRGLLGDTVFVVTGDHGEAFGNLHAKNFTHKNRIYEENVRSFLMVANPAIAGPVVSDRTGSTGDIVVTLAGVAGVAPPAGVLGKDLMVGRYPPRIVFFYKNAYPEEWGLRDGRWKFVGRIRDAGAELYDLRTDPYEHVNLAATDPARVRRYGALCRNWFVTANDRFTERLEGYRAVGGRGLRAADYKTPGPKVMAVGYRPTGSKVTFEEAREVAPDRPPVVWTRWVSYEADHEVTFEWVSPGGERYGAPIRVRSEWATTYVKYGGPVPMERGAWRVELRDGGKVLLEAGFEVR